jgi:phosphoribosylamine---glycine ligase
LKILVIGSGAREHAICWKLAQSPQVRKIFCAPGNAGTAEVAENIAIDAMDIEGLRVFVEHQKVDLTVVGPEKPLIAGIVDVFEARGLRIFGPSREPAQLEGSKVFSKRLMKQAGVPTADFEVFDDSEKARAYLQQASFPIVVKADGEAAGKGVVVAQDYAEAETAISQMMDEKIFGASGERVVIEACLRGPEASVLAFVDGETVRPMIAIQDHKRIGEGDTGPNTGGMGAYAPVKVAPQSVVDDVTAQIIEPIVTAIRGTGIPYRGVLYAGVMLTENGPYCIEFNCRFGDPEAQVALMLLESDLATICQAVVDVELDKVPVVFSPRAAVTVAMASGGYPGSYATGLPITGLEAAQKLDALEVFHAGTKRDEAGSLLTNGGRVLTVTATGETFGEAKERAYAGVDLIHFDGAYVRRDIGWQAEK